MQLSILSDSFISDILVDASAPTSAASPAFISQDWGAILRGLVAITVLLLPIGLTLMLEAPAESRTEAPQPVTHVRVHLTTP